MRAAPRQEARRHAGHLELRDVISSMPAARLAMRLPIPLRRRGACRGWRCEANGCTILRGPATDKKIIFRRARALARPPAAAAPSCYYNATAAPL